MIFRKVKDLRRAEPMPKKQFQRICKVLKRMGISVFMGVEADALCDMQHVEAITFNKELVVFRKNPSRSVVFEELIHLHQYLSGRCDGSSLSRIQCEIEAKEKLLKYSEAYGLTTLDIEITRRVLDEDYLDMKRYSERRMS